MIFQNAEEVLDALIQAYYVERNVVKTLDCVSEDIQWVGTEHNDSAKGKQNLKELLEEDVKMLPASLHIEFSMPEKQIFDDNVVLFTIEGIQKKTPGMVTEFILRGTVCCVKTTEHGWLIYNVHASTPNAEVEKYLLQQRIEENKRRERAIMASIPGGVAIYRLKKDGRVETEFVSESLAKICGYTAEEFLDLLKEDALVNLVPEDIPNVMKKVSDCLEQGIPINMRYRIYTKNKEKLLIRLDATVVTSEALGKDDMAILYAVHTPVSEEVKKILADQRKLQQLVNEVPGGLGIYEIEDGVAKLTYLNDAYYKLLGFDRTEREQYIGENHISAINPDDKEKMLSLIKDICQGKQEGNVQYQIKNSNGQWMWLNLAASVVERNDNKIIVYTTFTDCNEIVRAKEKLQEEQDKMQAILSAIPGGVAIYRIKKDGRIPAEYISDGLARVCGYEDVEEFMKIMGEDSRKLVYPEDYKRIGEISKQSVSEHKGTHVNYRFIAKNGRPIWISMDSVLLGNVTLGPDDLAVFYTVQIPISQEAIRAQEEQDYYRTILNMTNTAFFELDDQGKYYTSDSYSNYKLSEAGMEGIQGGDAALKCVHPDDLEKIHDYLIHIMQGRSEKSVVIRMLMKDGTYQWTEITGHIEYDDKQQFRRMTGILRDINTEWAKQKEDLELALQDAKNANLAKTAFLSRISHDMRTPLNGILGLTHILKDNTQDAENLNDLNELEIAGKYLLNLINDTLDMSRIESGKLELHPSVCDGRTFVKTVLGLAKTSIEAKGLDYEVHIDEIPFTTLFIDVARLQQVIMNVVSNAVKFTPAGGKIMIAFHNIAREKGELIDQLVISDTGIGMSKEFLPHLFDAFAQEDATRTSSAQGTGLGMSITKKLVDLMGGEIKVESELGKGTTFTITLRIPIATEEQKKNTSVRR